MAGAVRNGNAAMSSSTSSADESEIQYHTDGTSFQVVDTKTETHHTFNVGYNDDIIRTTVTPEASIVDEWIEDLYASIEEFPEEGLVVGLDIEWVRLQETSQRNKIDVLQLCFDKQCLIFQFFGCDKVSEKLGNFLSDSRIVFVGSGIDKDARKLFVDYDLFVARSEDLGPLADYRLGRKNLYKKNLKILVEEVLGEKLPKYGAITLSRWDIGDKYDKGYLRKEQVMHACLDAYASFKVGMDLIHRPDPSKKEFSYSNKDFKKLPQETNQGTKATNQGQGARDASSQGQSARDASQGPKETNQGQGTRDAASQGPKAAYQGQGARSTNQSQGTKETTQGQGAKTSEQGQGPKAPNQGQGSRAPFREYESRITRYPTTLGDFIFSRR